MQQDRREILKPSRNLDDIKACLDTGGKRYATGDIDGHAYPKSEDLNRTINWIKVLGSTPVMHGEH